MDFMTAGVIVVCVLIVALASMNIVEMICKKRGDADG